MLTCNWKKNHHECLSAFTGYSFTCARYNAARMHLLENRDHVDGFQEIKVDGKTSGVITQRKDLKRPSEFLEQLFCVY